MLVSATLHLHALEDGQIHGATGRAVHGFWFEQWKRIAPDIGDALHRPTAEQPFTLSPLLDLPRPQRGLTRIPRGAAAWLRITTLERTLSERLLERWLPLLSGTVTLAGLHWAVERIGLASAEHPAAGRDRYDRILAAAEEDTADCWTVEFTTPTTFHVTADSYLPFPLPAMLVNSWRRRWDAFAPVALPPLAEGNLRDNLRISAYRLKTVPVRHGRSVDIGCVGELRLNGSRLSAGERTAVRALAAYAHFCGTGHHTTRGLGQTALQVPQPARRALVARDGR